MDWEKYGIVFLVGGALCAVGQILISKTRLTPARILVLYVVAGALLTGAGVYGPLVEFAHAGATVPLTGFGYALATGAIEATQEHGILGVLIGGVSATAAGVEAAMLLSFIAALLCKPKAKK